MPLNNDDIAPYTRLVDHWENVLRNAPSAPILYEQNGRTVITRKMLNDAANELIQAHGLDLYKNQVIAFQIKNSMLWWTWFLAIRKAGATALPLDMGTPQSIINSILTHNNCALFINAQGHLSAYKDQSWYSPEPSAPFSGVIKLTSGTTGLSKSLWFTDRELIADTEHILATMKITPEDKNYAVIPFSHSYALGNLVIPLFVHGIPCVMGSDLLPTCILEEISTTQCTVFPATPHIFNALAKVEHANSKWETLRTLISAAAPLAPSTAQLFLKSTGKVIHNFYGSSETGGIAYDRTGDYGLEGSAVGTALEGVKVSITPKGLLRVESSAIYHYQNPEAENGKLPKFTTGDYANIESDGSLVLKGRADRIIKKSGQRIDLAQLERSILNLSGVETALFQFDTKTNHLNLAYTGSMSEGSLKQELSKLFSTVCLPNKISHLPSLPVNSRGKTLIESH